MADARACILIVAASRIEVHRNGYHAYYGPPGDVIYALSAHAFNGADLWAELALHELDHAIGAPSHLDRKLSTIFWLIGLRL